MNVSYQKILNAFEDFANSHLQIQRFESEFEEQLPNFATEKENYPILFVAPSNSIFDENANQFTLTVSCFDIIQKDRSNINTILSDTNTILNDVYRWFKDGEVFGIDIIGDAPNSTPINNALLDYAAGWEMVITFEVDTYGVCEIPFSPAPTPEPTLGYVTIYDSNGNIVDFVLNNGTYILGQMGNYSLLTLVSGVVDGNNNIFTFSDVPVQVVYNGNIVLESNYVLVGNQITLNFIPFMGESITAYGNA
jgi:hypothetical protein